MIWLKKPPVDSGYYLCAVLIPKDGGGSSRSYRDLYWDGIYKQWSCSGMIVTHWTALPDDPEQQQT